MPKDAPLNKEVLDLIETMYQPQDNKETEKKLLAIAKATNTSDAGEIYYRLGLVYNTRHTYNFNALESKASIHDVIFDSKNRAVRYFVSAFTFESREAFKMLELYASEPARNASESNIKNYAKYFIEPEQLKQLCSSYKEQRGNIVQQKQILIKIKEIAFSKINRTDVRSKALVFLGEEFHDTSVPQAIKKELGYHNFAILALRLDSTNIRALKLLLGEVINEPEMALLCSTLICARIAALPAVVDNIDPNAWIKPRAENYLDNHANPENRSQFYAYASVYRGLLTAWNKHIQNNINPNLIEFVHHFFEAALREAMTTKNRQQQILILSMSSLLLRMPPFDEYFKKLNLTTKTTKRLAPTSSTATSSQTNMSSSSSNKYQVTTNTTMMSQQPPRRVYSTHVTTTFSTKTFPSIRQSSSSAQSHANTIGKDSFKK